MKTLTLIETAELARKRFNEMEKQELEMKLRLISDKRKRTILIPFYHSGKTAIKELKKRNKSLGGV